MGRGAAGDREGRGAIPRPAGSELYDPVYDAAQETGLPIAIHSVEATFSVFPFQLEQFPTAMAVHALAHPLAMIANLVSLLETGVPVRFLRLGIAFMEAGTSLEFHVATGGCVAFEDSCLRSYDVRVGDQGEIAVVI
jgi:hypothetical protein